MRVRSGGEGIHRSQGAQGSECLHGKSRVNRGDSSGGCFVTKIFDAPEKAVDEAITAYSQINDRLAQLEVKQKGAPDEFDHYRPRQ